MPKSINKAQTKEKCFSLKLQSEIHYLKCAHALINSFYNLRHQIFPKDKRLHGIALLQNHQIYLCKNNPHAASIILWDQKIDLYIYHESARTGQHDYLVGETKKFALLRIGHFIVPIDKKIPLALPPIHTFIYTHSYQFDQQKKTYSIKWKCNSTKTNGGL